jgi:hypothetical protein
VRAASSSGLIAGDREAVAGGADGKALDLVDEKDMTERRRNHDGTPSHIRLRAAA